MDIANIDPVSRKFFTALSLPLPAAEAFIQGHYCNTAILADYGMVIRVSENAHTQYHDHPRVLQPLLALRGNAYTAEMFPAIRNEISGSFDDVASILDRSLAADGLCFSDMLVQNIGLVSDELGQDYAIILDRDAVKKAEDLRYFADAGIVPQREDANPQQAFFKPLRDLANECFAGISCGMSPPDSVKVAAFWRYCRREIDKSRRDQHTRLYHAFVRAVHPSSVSFFKRSQKIVAAAQAYARQLPDLTAI